MSYHCAVPNCKKGGEFPVRQDEESEFFWICREHAEKFCNSFVTNRMAFHYEGKLATDLIG